MATSDDSDLKRADVELAVQSLTEVLLGAARGDFSVRAQRSGQGDPLDVLAFLVNSAAEEIGDLVTQVQEEQAQLQRARDQLLMNTKLAALGELAAGVAHELNQPLTAVQMLLDLLRSNPDAKISDCSSELETLAEASRRMARIVSGVRAFGHSEPMRLQPTRADLPLVQALRLLDETLLRKHIRVERRLPETMPTIHADSDRLHQVFVNLLTNARDALEDVSEPRLIVELSLDLGRVVYSFEDNGAGIDDDVASRIFDPFFTTKGVGKGTGLGLSVSHGIVIDHGGALQYRRGQHGGARFSVDLP